MSGFGPPPWQRRAEAVPPDPAEQERQRMWQRIIDQFEAKHRRQPRVILEDPDRDHFGNRRPR